MISTRVMDFKLREAAEGLGEDSTGKASLPLLWGESSLGCGQGEGLTEPGHWGSLHGEWGFSSQHAQTPPGSFIPRPEDLQCRGSSFASVRHGGRVRVIFPIPVPMFD